MKYVFLYLGTCLLHSPSYLHSTANRNQKPEVLCFHFRNRPYHRRNSYVIIHYTSSSIHINSNLSSLFLWWGRWRLHSCLSWWWWRHLCTWLSWGWRRHFCSWLSSRWRWSLCCWLGCFLGCFGRFFGWFRIFFGIFLGIFFLLFLRLLFFLLSFWSLIRLVVFFKLTGIKVCIFGENFSDDTWSNRFASFSQSKPCPFHNR